MQTLANSTRFSLAGPDDPALNNCIELLARKRQLNKKPRLWGYRDGVGALWFYDAYEGERAIRWIEKFCRHRKGEWAGKLFKLSPWQKRIVRQLFGWFGENGLRKFKEAWIEVPRKNGKSTLMAAIAIYLTVADREPAAEVYCVAGSEKQALLVYGDAYAMVSADENLSSVIVAGKKAMVHSNSDSRLMALGKSNQHGLNVHAFVGDEVHEWRNGDQYEAMTTAMGARRQPLGILITTAGHDLASLCGRLHQTALQVRAGVVYRPNLYVRIYAAPDGADWKDERTWHAANPGLKYGAPRIEALRDAYQKALQSPSEENSFKRLHLNIWTDRQTAWIRRDDWNACRGDIDWAKLAGARCFAGLDLAKVQDLSALALLFPPDNPALPGQWIVGMRYWCPDDNIRNRSRADGVDYQAWAQAGKMNATPGPVTDFDEIERDILRLAQHFKIEGLGFDPFLAQQLIQHVMQAGVSCVEVRQGFLTLGPPTAELERMVIGRELTHGGHPIMDWNISNVVAVSDAAGNLKPHKVKSGQKIDGAAALINALALGMTTEIEPNISAFLSSPIMSVA